MIKGLIWFAVFASLNFYSCDAPRDNPLDPDSGTYSLLEGFVQSFSLPYTPLPDVSVYWAPSNIMVKTGAGGRFRIDNPERKDSYLVFQKEGYRTDSIHIIWGDNKRYNLQVNLNRIPVLKSSDIFTSVVNYSDGTRSFELILKAVIEDIDKDIDSVYVRNSRFNISRTLEYDIINKFYQISLSSDEIPLSEIEETVGEDFVFYVADLFGKEYNVGKDQVTRVIRSAAEVISPDNNIVVDSLPTLSWKRFQPGYNHTYSVDVYKSDLTNPQLVFRSAGISMDSASVNITSPLTAADYFWVIWTTDSFNNSCRSKPGTFSVR